MATDYWAPEVTCRDAIYNTVFDWHTLEGPFVRKRAGHYWLFYSGGSWQQAATERLRRRRPSDGPYIEPQPGPVILETVPGEVIGAGSQLPRERARFTLGPS